MSELPRVEINMLPTSIPGLDEVLGGGLPEFSFNLIEGSPGTGKTTLAHQIMFGLASPERTALYFTVMGEPPLKMLRYQQQMSFYAPSRIGESIQFIDLSTVVMEHDLAEVLATIIRHVEENSPSIVIVDSFQTIARAVNKRTESHMDMPRFVQSLAVHLTSWQATTFLIGENMESEFRPNPVFTVADGIIQLTQITDRNSSVRMMKVVKSRGQAPMPGLHTFRITPDGLRVYPRMSMAIREDAPETPTERALTGVPGLDTLVGGGIPAGDVLLVSGASGTGKSVLATHFVAAGAQADDPGVIAVFEEHPREYLERARSLGIDLEELERQGRVKILYLRPLDLSPDETLDAIRQAVAEIGARRVVIDSVSGFELALAPVFRQDFRESLYRLVASLTGIGVTVLLTMEIVQDGRELRFSPYIVSFLSDNILLLSYVEIEGQLLKSLSVVKMRKSDHSKEYWLYEIAEHGMLVGESLTNYQRIGTGVPELRRRVPGHIVSGLTVAESAVLHALIELGEANAESLAAFTGLSEADVTGAMQRIISIGYAIQEASETDSVYRPTGLT